MLFGWLALLGCFWCLFTLVYSGYSLRLSCCGWLFVGWAVYFLCVSAMFAVVGVGVEGGTARFVLFGLLLVCCFVVWIGG